MIENIIGRKDEFHSQDVLTASASFLFLTQHLCSYITYVNTIQGHFCWGQRQMQRLERPPEGRQRLQIKTYNQCRCSDLRRMLSGACILKNIKSEEINQTFPRQAVDDYWYAWLEKKDESQVVLVSLVSLKASCCMLETQRHKAAAMHQTWRHKSAVRKTLNSAITSPAALHKLSFSPNPLWHLLSKNWTQGRKSLMSVEFGVVK